MNSVRPLQPSAMPASRAVLASVATFGFASGLPLALTGSTLQAWLTAMGVDLRTLGALSLLGLPYLTKFLWAPVLDRYPLGRWSRRRGWLLAMQALLAVTIALLSASNPAADLDRIVACGLLIAIASATQDIAVDAYRAEALPSAQRGLGAGLSVAGYRLAMLVSGALTLLAADRFGFQLSFAGLSALCLGLAVLTVMAPEPVAVAEGPGSLREAFATQLRILATRPGFIGLLAVIVLYKLGDAFAGTLTMTFLLRGQGFTLTEIGTVYKALGIVAAIAGGITGGWWMTRLGLYRALFAFGLLQGVTNLGFLALALSAKSLVGMILVVALENFSGGMGTSALLALLMALCDARYTATHFATLSAIASLSRVISGPFAGNLAEYGWVSFFAWSVFLALPGLLALRLARAPIESLDAVRK